MAKSKATPRIILPGELRRALAAAPRIREYFQRLPPSHRRQYATWVAQARKPETRERRAARAVELLRAGKSSG